MLPHIQHQQWGEVHGSVALLIGQLLNEQATSNVVVTQHGPAGTLQAECCCGEVRLELLEGTKVAVDSLRELTGWLAATVRAQVLPEDGVVGVATQVESQVLGQCTDAVWVGFAVALFFQGVQSRVSTLYVSVVVLGVVQLHDFAGDVWLQSVVVIFEFWEFVNSHYR